MGHKAEISSSEMCIQMKNAICLKFFVLDDEIVWVA